METFGDSKSSYRSRGRIAQVLAQARASLKEPSRPFTPASLDARTSLTTGNDSNMKNESINNVKSVNSILHEKLLDQNQISNSRGILGKSINDAYFTSKAATNINENQISGNTHSLQLLVFDTNDIISSLDSEIIIIRNDSYGHIFEILENLSINIDKISKYMKDYLSLPHTGK